MFLACCCARCQRPLRVLGCYQGKTLRCPGCAAAVVVPAAETPPIAAAVVSRSFLPWVLLAPAALALVLLMWTGHGVLWAGLGVALGGLCLLLGQRGRWPVSVRVSTSLSVALLGHGLTLASPLWSAPKGNPPQTAAPLALASPSAEVEASLLTGLRRNSSSRSPSPDLQPVAQLLEDPEPQVFRSPSPDLQPVAQLGALLSASFFLPASGDGVAIVTTADGSCKLFTYPAFPLRATYWLEQPAYRAVTDSRRGVLWTAACAPANLRVNRHGDQPLGRADLHVYDIPRPGEGRITATARLHPRRVLPLASDVLELLISPDQDALFYLAQSDEGVRLGRIDADRQALDRQVPLPQGIRALCLTPDGKTLYAAGDGSVLILDPTTLQTRRRLEVRADACAVAADNDGRIYLAEQGQWTQLTRIDLRGAQPAIHQWTSRMHGRIYLKIAPDYYRLYIGTSSVISNHLDSLLIRGYRWNVPVVWARAVSSPQARVQGEFFLTPDGRFLVNRWGTVFRLAQGEPILVPFDS